VFFSHPVHAEWYVAGQGGVSFSNSFNNGEGVGSTAGLSISDLDLHKAPMYGAKLGYYFDSMKWLGVEMEAFSSTPHLKQQTATVSFGGVSATGTAPGQDVRVTNWGPHQHRVPLPDGSSGTLCRGGIGGILCPYP